jgi:hypothetical protein
MPAEMISSQSPSSRDQEPVIVSGELRCALTGRVLSPDEAYWAPPVVTVRELITTFVSTLMRTPGSLGQVLLGELPNVPYAPEAREQLAARRTAEQLKLLGLVLLIAALLVVPIVLIVP